MASDGSLGRCQDVGSEREEKEEERNSMCVITVSDG
jgi:hypothetical protein